MVVFFKYFFLEVIVDNFDYFEGSYLSNFLGNFEFFKI